DGDAFGIYLGRTPSFRSRAGAALFTVAIGGTIPVRGARWTEGARQRIEAVATLPCAAPRYVHAWMQSDAPDRLARMYAALGTLRLAPDARTTSRSVVLDATRDGPALAGIVAQDALGRDLAARALAGDGLAAPYPLETTHPLADQVLLGRYRAV